MSRLLVKNLPDRITDKRLRDHFGSQGGLITDVKLAHRPDGTFRRFAFVGFKSEDDAAKAKLYFDRTYIDAAKISVLRADTVTERPAKRRRLSIQDGASIAKVSKKADVPAESEKEGLSEFLNVMRPRTNERTWANEPAVDQPMAVDEPMHPLAVQKSDEIMLLDDPSNTGDEPDGGEEVSDMEWMKRRMMKAKADAEANVDMAKEVSPNKPPDPPLPSSTDILSTEQQDAYRSSLLEPLNDNPRLYLTNISYQCSEADIADAFARFGKVEQVHIVLDSKTHKPRGMAFITLDTTANAITALESMDRKDFQGRILHVIPAVDRRPRVAGADQKSSLKETRMERTKQQASKDFNWSMLYMNSDAVAASVADRFKIAKADIFSPASEDAAVKLALAETHVIQETKDFLEKQGVVLDAFQSKARSPTAILVKNIPYGTTLDELKDMFSPHGTIVRLLLPPAGTIALVELSSALEATTAFKAVAYRRLKNSVIYLEKAPLGVFSPESAKNIVGGVDPVKISEVEDTEATKESSKPDDSEDANVTGATLYLKNLSFGTTTEKLVSAFRHLPSFAFARVQTKPDPKVPGGTLSMGYGFVGFKDRVSSMSAIGSLNGFTLDGHTLSVKLAKRGAETTEKPTQAKDTQTKSNKLIVKNLPFEVSKKEIRSLFSAHGQLKSVRLPKKFDASSRGFAFLEFVTHKEAQNAFDALKFTHVLGRHMVLEWAKTDLDTAAGDELDMLREKVRAAYGDGKAERPGRKQKINMDVGSRGQDGNGEEEGDFIAV